MIVDPTTHLQDVGKRNESAGLKQVREGREKRFEDVRQAMQARRDADDVNR